VTHASIVELDRNLLLDLCSSSRPIAALHLDEVGVDILQLIPSALEHLGYLAVIEFDTIDVESISALPKHRFSPVLGNSYIVRALHIRHSTAVQFPSHVLVPQTFRTLL
jgi:hypothetical protein